MAYVLFIHGLDNKPEQTYLYDLWKRKLAHDGGIDLDEQGVKSSMDYWANVLYASPDIDLASYESLHGEVECIAGVPSLRLDEHLSGADVKRLKSLADRLQVDWSTTYDLPLPPDEIIGVRQERIPVPEWLRTRIMAKFVRDAHHYFFNVEFSPRPGETYRVRDELRRRFVDGLKAGVGKGPLVVISHSMGTVIAYDCLMHVPDCPAIDGLMTIGSPLGLDEVQDFFPGLQRDNGFPKEKLRGNWINVYDPLDVIAALDPCLANDFMSDGQPAIDDISVDNPGYWKHSISKYLQQSKLRERLASMLGVQ
jgi:hypothetical protein